MRAYPGLDACPRIVLYKIEVLWGGGGGGGVHKARDEPNNIMMQCIYISKFNDIIHSHVHQHVVEFSSLVYTVVLGYQS